jgi:hypothetical protein
MMPLFNTGLPANAGMVFGFIMNVASFNLLPTEQFYNTYFNMSQDDHGPLNNNFDDQGYKSTYFIQNMGTLMIAILTTPLLFVFYYILSPFTRCSTVL